MVNTDCTKGPCSVNDPAPWMDSGEGHDQCPCLFPQWGSFPTWEYPGSGWPTDLMCRLGELSFLWHLESVTPLINVFLPYPDCLKKIIPHLLKVYSVFSLLLGYPNLNHLQGPLAAVLNRGSFVLKGTFGKAWRHFQLLWWSEWGRDANVF